MKILTSASKVVFLAIAAAVIAAVFVGKITGDQFLILASMCFTYYFTRKGDTQINEGKQ